MGVLGGNKELTDLLRKTPVVLRALTGGMEDDAAHQRDSEGWSVVEIVGHLIDAELRAIDRIAMIQRAQDPVLEGYDQTGMVAERAYQERQLPGVLDEFERLREERVAALERLDDADWERRATLSAYGEASLREITIHMCWHDVNHLAQIAALLQSETR